MTIKSIRTGWTGISALAGNPVIGDFESIQTVTVGSGGAANVEFTNIPQTYTHLQVRAMVRSARVANSDYYYRRFNEISTSVYTRHWVIGDGATPSSTGTANVNEMDYPGIPASQATSSSFDVSIMDILDYTNTNKFKTVRTLGGYDLNGSGLIGLVSNLYRSTDAITSIKFIGGLANFSQYTTFALYGIR